MNSVVRTKNSILKEVAILSFILLFALGIRLYFMYEIPHPELFRDAKNYDTMAIQFIEKGFLGYASKGPNAFITPGYPLMLVVIYEIFGYSNGSPLTQVRIFQIILSVITIGLLYLIAREFINKRTAIISAILSSIYLVSIWVPTTILTETLYTFLFMLYLYFQIIALKKKSILLNFVTGLIFAAAILVRPAIAPLMIIPYAHYYLQTKDKWYIKAFFFNICGFLILMTPWWLRNIITMKKFIMFASQEDPLLRGTYPYGIGEENIPYKNQNQEAIKRLVHGFKNETWLYIKWFTLGKFEYIFLKIYYYVDESITTLRKLVYLHYFYVWFGWVGVFASLVRKEIRLIALFIFLTTLIQLVFVSTSRYSYPLMHLLIILTAYILDIVFTKDSSKKLA